ncbi:MAG: AAA family ATPase [Bacteroidota bacterium]|nr:AAA family ATPase [Bacteroidota bacterium]MDX5505295.1 AAA family ATPase [Bacteroidota bacterium]
MSTVRDKILLLLPQLAKGLEEREEVVKLALLSAIASESIFLLGPPGVGKSLVARRLKHAFSEGREFEYLMTRFSTPEEVFGPISIKRLKEEDTYERLTDSYLPGANIVFLDEIWKASSSIQNALLTIINEKVYRNGATEQKVDLRALITASNELPPDTENFAPIYDRFLIRYKVDGIKDDRRFLEMITRTDDLYLDPVEEEQKIKASEMRAWDRAIDQVEIGNEILDTVQWVRKRIDDWNEKNSSSRPIRIYDRRWKKIIRLIRTSAFLNGRSRADLMDAFLMIHCLWDTPEQLPIVRDIVTETIRDHGYSLSIGLRMIRREVSDLRAEVDRELRVKVREEEEVLRPYEGEYYRMEKNGQYFEGEFIKVKDLNLLNRGDLEILNIYDSEWKLVNRLQAERSPQRFSIRVHHQSNTYDFGLTTHKNERVRTVKREPHPLVRKDWDERIDHLRAHIDQQIERLRNDLPEALSHQTNLFIDDRLRPIVEANHKEVAQTLDELRLEIDKIHHDYAGSIEV